MTMNVRVLSPQTGHTDTVIDTDNETQLRDARQQFASLVGGSYAIATIDGQKTLVTEFPEKATNIEYHPRLIGG